MPLHPQAVSLLQLMESMSVPTIHVRFNGMFHGFVSLAGFVDDGRAATALAAASLGAASGRS